MSNSSSFQNIRELMLEDIYAQLISILEYKDSPFFKIDETGIYDMLYYVNIEKEEYPVVGIKCLESSDEATISKQHLLFWNRNDVPISVIILSGELRIYNNFSRKRIKALLYNSSDVQNSDDIINDLRASKIVTKVVWERLEKLSNSGERVDKQLLSNLRNTVLQAQSECGMLLEDAYNFMSLCIFVKYLEDRGMLTSQFFTKWDTDTFTNFLNIANPEKLSEFFRILKKRFNGDLFSISEEKLPADKQLDVFYRFFRGDDILNDGNSQLRLFPYDFSVIPIGLISNIYETFFSIDVGNKNEKLSTKTGAFYTPHYLADFMVQKSFLAYTNRNSVPCVIDPACGSGIFLVESFKRQIDILKEFKGNLRADDLRNLMENNIYGVDVNLGALKISCFSLYIALLDELTPKDIMENQFRFPNLIGNNLLEGSFFSPDIEFALSGKKFDIIIGNPPWKSMAKSDHISYCKKRDIPIADKQIAQAFLSRANDYANEETQILFLITNSIFTNKNSVKFLRYILDNYCIESITNLEAVKTQLFDHAKYPCSIWEYRCIKKENYVLKYQVFQENGLFKLLHKFVCDKTEEISISKNRIIGREYVWTILTYGDEFDVECIEKMLSFPALSQSINGKIDFVQGYITASNGNRNPEFAGYRGGSLKGVFLPYGVDYERVPMLSQDTLFDRPRKIEIYTCSHKVLVKRTYNEKCWGAAYVQEPLIFSNDFSTFNDYTGENVELLRYIEGILNSDIFRYYCFYMTKVKAAKKPEVVKEDIMRFPVPVFDKEDINIKYIINLVIQMERQVHKEWELRKSSPWNMYNDSKSKLQGELNRCIFKLYGFDKFHISIIKEGLERFSKKHQTEIATEEDYQKYANYFCDYFNYYMKETLDNSWKMEKKEGDFYTGMYFSFGHKEKIIYPDIAGFSGLEAVNEQLLVQRKVLLFVNDGFHIIQSKDKTNWTLGKAKKMVAKITREIMNGGEQIYE